ncbi:hypothetical protein MVT46_24485, partial [Salmonella sp. L-S2906]
FAGASHQILESEPPLRVNRNSPSSASNLILPHGMADHRIDIDAVEDPVKLLCRQRHHRSLSPGPPEPVFCQFLQDHNKPGPIKEQKLHPVMPAIAEGKH